MAFPRYFWGKVLYFKNGFFYPNWGCTEERFPTFGPSLCLGFLEDPVALDRLEDRAVAGSEGTMEDFRVPCGPPQALPSYLPAAESNFPGSPAPDSSPLLYQPRDTGLTVATEILMRIEIRSLRGSSK